jgi:hypothetical protein
LREVNRGITRQTVFFDDTIQLPWSDVRVEDDCVMLTFTRTKRSKTVARSPNVAISNALIIWLELYYGQRCAEHLHADESARRMVFDYEQLERPIVNTI